MISVVIIFLDAGRFLEQAIESVRAQSHDDWELLLVDDGSTDASRDTARRYASTFPGRIRCLEHPGHENRGMSASRNLGVRHARGHWIAFLDSDDEWTPDHLARRLAHVTTDPDAEFIYGPVLIWFSWDPAAVEADSVQFIGSGLPQGTALAQHFLRYSGGTPTPSAIMVRRDTFGRLGGFEEQFKGMFEDQVFTFKVALHARVAAIPDVTVRYRRHDLSCCAANEDGGTAARARIRFLTWARAYVRRDPRFAAAIEPVIRWHLWQARRGYGVLGAADRLVRRVAPAALLKRLRRPAPR